jgi:superoxide dismutase, Fe-Mn family
MEKNFDRRTFIKNTGKAGIAAGLSASVISSFASDSTLSPLLDKVPFTQEPLPYDYKALEPVIDAQTMELHYSKHAAGYASKLAEAVKEENFDTSKTSLEDLLKNISKYSSKMRNNAGGHYNHTLFWKMMNPTSSAKQPSEKLMAAITKDFGSMDVFKTQFSTAAKDRFGSGWAWLVVGADKKLQVTSSPNQDNTLMDVSEIKGYPLLGLDVWEHAYYLKYQNKRPDYITAWWQVVNWEYVQQRFDSMS